MFSYLYNFPELATFLIAALPIGELRAAIPVAINVYKLSPWWVFLIAVFGNIVPIIFILLFLDRVSQFLSRHFYFFNRFFAWLFEKARSDHAQKIEKWKELALVIFVAIPLPLTGAWMGSVVAFVFGFPFKIAFPLISLGVIIAGIAVTAFTMAGVFIEQYFGWQLLLALILIAGLLWVYLRFRKRPTP